MELLASGYSLIEGPRVDRDGGLYFSDVHRGGVYRRDPDGTIDTVIPKRRGVGGMVFHRDGGLVVSGRNIQHVRDGASRILFEADDVGGFNDLHTDSAGNVYVGSLRSDPFDTTGNSRVPGDCYRISATGTEKLYGDIGLTNGIGFSPDGSVLYHVDTAAGAVIAHDVNTSGEISHRRVFLDVERGSPDGMTVDMNGGLWIASYGGGCVIHANAAGVVQSYLDVPATAVTSVCFGNDEDLFIVTADNTVDPDRGGAIFHTRVAVGGLPTPLATV